MKQTSKAIARRQHIPDYTRRFFVGEGVDIGGGPDPLGLYQEFFCRIVSVRTWDIADGDAQTMPGIPDDAFDFVHSSHCLEHLREPLRGLERWMEILRPGGHMIVTVPDEDLYEQGQFPSTFNADHKWTFTIHKVRSWSPASLNVLDLVRGLGAGGELVRLERLTSTYQFGLPRYDQTLTPITESGIEFVVRKRTAKEIEAGGRTDQTGKQPPPEIRRHLNQYEDDLRRMKAGNAADPPFRNDRPV